MILCLCPNPSIDKYVWLNEFLNGKVNRIEKEQFFPGGKGIHVALGIAELGEECCILGFWGGGTGQWIRQFCEEKGIKCYGPEVNVDNRTCLTFRSKGNLDRTELLGIGPCIEEVNLKQYCIEFTKLLNHASAVCMSGSWPPTSSKIDYSSFIKVAKGKNVKTFIDCSGKALISSLEANPYCVHINQQEGYEVFNEESPVKIANRVIKNCDVAAITCGDKGLYLSDKSHKVAHANCKLENIINTVGCGDALMAGLIVASTRNLNIVDTARLSVACGSANCIREELGMFYKEDAMQLMEQTKITLLAMN